MGTNPVPSKSSGRSSCRLNLGTGMVGENAPTMTTPVPI